MATKLEAFMQKIGDLVYDPTEMPRMGRNTVPEGF